jgi:hypothetical protein
MVPLAPGVEAFQLPASKRDVLAHNRPIRPYMAAPVVGNSVRRFRQIGTPTGAEKREDSIRLIGASDATVAREVRVD